MTIRHSLQVLALSLTLPVFAACGGSSSDDTGMGPTGGVTQTATAVATPANATVARGGSANTTIVWSATGGLVFTGSFSIQRQYAGITIDQTSRTGSGANITETFTIGADATVPLGTHNVFFSTMPNGWVGMGTRSGAQVAFVLTVTP